MQIDISILRGFQGLFYFIFIVYWLFIALLGKLLTCKNSALRHFKKPYTTKLF